MDFRTRFRSRAIRLLVDPRVQRARRAAHEGLRVVRRQPHRVTWFHRADDPHSLLLAHVLRDFVDRYDVELVCRTIGEAPPDAVPEPFLHARWASSDAELVADDLAIDVPRPFDEPRHDALAAAKQRLVAAESEPQAYLELACELGAQLFAGDPIQANQSVAAVRGVLTRNEKLLARLGHYTSGSLHYGGEWYVRVDRLWHLERRLQGLGLGDGHSVPAPVTPSPDDGGGAGGGRLVAWVSFRSPYSWIAMDRLRAIAERWQLDLAIEPVRPGVSRGVPFPLAKRAYIVADAAREALRAGVEFTPRFDPMPGIEAALALWWQANERGLGNTFAHTVLRETWGRGGNLADRALRVRCAELSGLDSAAIAAAERSGEDTWRHAPEAHRKALVERGLWGVPSFAADGVPAVWGQDRLGLFERAIARTRCERQAPT